MNTKTATLSLMIMS